jgi:hypothetical protein
MNPDFRPSEHADLSSEHVVHIVYADGRPTLRLDWRVTDLREEFLDVRQAYREWLQSCCPDGLVFSD